MNHNQKKNKLKKSMYFSLISGCSFHILYVLSMIGLFIFLSFDDYTREFVVIMMGLLLLPLFGFLLMLHSLGLKNKLVLFKKFLIETRYLMKYERALVLIKNYNLNEAVDIYDTLPKNHSLRKKLLLSITHELRYSEDIDLKNKGNALLDQLIDDSSHSKVYNGLITIMTKYYKL